MRKQPHVYIYAALIGGSLAVVLLLFHGLAERVNQAEQSARDSRSDAHVAQQSIAVLAGQVKRLGGKPVVTPTALPETITGPAGVPGKPGQHGDQGIAGARGPVGRPGKDGSDGKNGLRGSDGRDGVNGGEGPAGPKGDPGADGKDGTDGVDGQDGQPGPPGPSGATGPAGYPDSFTYTAQGPGGLGNTTYVCRDPDGDHAYTCEATS